MYGWPTPTGNFYVRISDGVFGTLSHIEGLNKPYDMKALREHPFVRHVAKGTQNLIPAHQRAAETEKIEDILDGIQDSMFKGGIGAVYRAYRKYGFGINFGSRVFASGLCLAISPLFYTTFLPIIERYLSAPTNYYFDLFLLSYTLFAGILFPYVFFTQGNSSLSYVRDLAIIGRLLETPVGRSDIPYGSAIMAAAYFDSQGIQGPDRMYAWKNIIDSYGSRNPGTDFSSSIIDLLTLRPVEERMGGLLSEVAAWWAKEKKGGFRRIIPKNKETVTITYSDWQMIQKAAVLGAYLTAETFRNQYSIKGPYPLGMILRNPNVLDQIDSFICSAPSYDPKDPDSFNSWLERNIPIPPGAIEDPVLFESCLLSFPNELGRNDTESERHHKLAVQAAIGIRLNQRAADLKRGVNSEYLRAPGNLFAELFHMRAGPLSVIFNPTELTGLVETVFSSCVYQPSSELIAEYKKI